MNGEEFIGRVRERECFAHAILHKITVYRSEKRCEFSLITDRAYTEEDEKYLSEVVCEAAPQPLAASVSIVKQNADPQIVRNKIIEYLKASHNAAAAFVSAEDIGVSDEGNKIRFSFGVDAAERSFFETRNIVASVENMLRHNFCGEFFGELIYKEKAQPPLRTRKRRSPITGRQGLSKYMILNPSILRTCPKPRPISATVISVPILLPFAAR